MKNQPAPPAPPVTPPVRTEDLEASKVTTEKDPWRRDTSDDAQSPQSPAPLDPRGDVRTDAAGNAFVAPPAPTTESEIAKREASAKSIAGVSRVDYSDPAEPASARVAPVVRSTLGVSHIPGTEIVVGGPTQQ